jgi:hypothetical protein
LLTDRKLGVDNCSLTGSPHDVGEAVKWTVFTLDCNLFTFDSNCACGSSTCGNDYLELLFKSVEVVGGNIWQLDDPANGSSTFSDANFPLEFQLTDYTSPSGTG